LRNLKTADRFLLNKIFFQKPQTINEDEKFSSYLAGIMTDIPRKQKIILQAKVIAMVVEELKNL